MTLLTIDNLQQLFETYLKETMRYSLAPIDLLDPMIYSLLNGGKRVRPILLLWVLGVESADLLKQGLATALALESIHTYSLIHDDLPAMDNDDFRRGLPTNHKEFGEATAILAGDALLTDAFAMIADDDHLQAQTKVQLISLLSKAAGSQGMVAGQQADILSQGQDVNLVTLQAIHARKTGRLFRFAVQAASLIANLDQEASQLLDQFACHFGQAFQIHNDLMDQLADQSQTGKVGQADTALNKATYPALLGLEGAKDALNNEINGAKESLRLLTALRNKDYDSLSVFLNYLHIGD